MKKLLSVILSTLLALSLVACATPASTSSQSMSQSQNMSQPVSSNVVDRNGIAIELPEQISTIMSMTPITTQILVELGLGDKIIAVDTQSPLVTKELKEDILQMDMFAPDTEQIVALKPDLMFTTNMSAAGGADPFEAVRNAGVCVIEIPAAVSIDDIAKDVAFISACVGKSAQGETMVKTMMDTVNKVKDAAKAITTKKTVLFEIAPAPSIYSFGKNTFLNEMVETVGAINVLADQTDWVAVVEEAAVSANPDVILTSVNYIEAPIDEILARKGWQEVNAVKNKEVHYIDTDKSNIANHHIADALVEIAKAMYPEIYNNF